MTVIKLSGRAHECYNPSTRMDYFLRAIGENYTYSSTVEPIDFIPARTKFLNILEAYTKSNGMFTETQKFKLMRIWNNLK